VADIFHAHGEAYRRDHVLTPEQAEAMRAIESCRTAVLGGHLDTCPECGYERPSYNSCRHRNCPKCQSLEQARWIESRKERILPVPYFHTVFTLPHQLNPLVMRNQRLIYDLLFESASEALLEVAADPRHLGAQPAISLVLHTWTRDLRLHPHLHAIISGGGLSPAGDRWIRKNARFLLPKRVLGSLLRGKFLAGLRAAWEKDRLDLGGACSRLEDRGAFMRLLSKLYATGWLVYAKRAFAGPEHVIEYLGRYTHRTGISNHRLVAMNGDDVRFRTKDGHVVSVKAHEFIRRFLLHVLFKRFVKIRHYGLLAASNVNTRLVAARRALGNSTPPARHQRPDWRKLMTTLTGIDPMVCPRCKVELKRRPLPEIGTAHGRTAPDMEDSS
jgi:hypothetical protein